MSFHPRRTARFWRISFTFITRAIFTAAVCKALEHVEGSYAVAVLAASSPYLVCARKDSPLVLGKGESAVYVASDVPALLPYTKDVIRMKDGEIARIYADRVEIMDREGQSPPSRDRAHHLGCRCRREGRLSAFHAQRDS